MSEQMEFANTWEKGLVEVARRRLDTLTELHNDFCGGTPTFDIDGALNELCAITDLIYESAFEFSEDARLALSQVNEEAMEVMRSRAGRFEAIPRSPGKLEVDPTIALYDAILSNLPTLAAGKTSGHALALSMTMHDDLAKRCGSRPRYQAVSSVIHVQDFKAMELAGRPRIKS
ncbi:hypothetical protein [Pseudomonas sp.]|uniref:hypothetical protein n=1 Tax=Pseudomonas sp. TaxID=306 RepID=UPI0028B183DE|nr:hypothetical protein [Pseudomonas sp.]